MSELCIFRHKRALSEHYLEIRKNKVLEILRAHDSTEVFLSSLLKFLLSVFKILRCPINFNDLRMFTSTIVKSKQISKEKKVCKFPANSTAVITCSNFVYVFLQAFALNAQNWVNS